MNIEHQARVTINVPNHLSGGSFMNDTGIVTKQLENPSMVEVLVTSGQYIGRTFSFIKSYLQPITG